MQTPYSSFTNVDRYLAKEYPVPFSAHGEVYRDRMEFFNLGETINNVSTFLNSAEVKNVTSAAKSVANTVKTVKTANSKPTSTGAVTTTYTEPYAGNVGIWDKYKLAIISGSAVVVALIVTIVIIKTRKK